MPIQWSRLLVDQLEFYWQVHLWPRLQGLTDEEYLWEPVDGCWSVRPAGDGRHVLDGGDDDPPPVTTIAWRMMHLATGVLGNRASAFFGDGSVPADATMFDPRHSPESLPTNASGGLTLLEAGYRRWREGIAGLDDEAMAAPLGPKGVRFANDPMAGLVLHLSRETMHHGGEICLLRDLYRARAT